MNTAIVEASHCFHKTQLLPHIPSFHLIHKLSRVNGSLHLLRTFYFLFDSWMMPRYRSRIVKRDATSHHPHHWSDPSNQGKYPTYSYQLFCALHSNTEYTRLDLHEDTEKNVVTASFEFPGFQINFQNEKLSVSAETKKFEHNADTGYTLIERLHGASFHVRFRVYRCVVLFWFERMSTDDCRCTEWTDYSDHGKWSLDCHVPKGLAWTRTKDRHLGIR